MRGVSLSKTLLVGFLIVVSFGAVSVAEQILFVVASTSLNTGDQAVYDLLSGRGHTVTLVNAGNSSSSDAEGKDAVLISSTCSSSQVGNKFTSVAVPVICWEPWLFDDLEMTGTSSSTDYGMENSQSDVVIVNSGHQLAAGLSGTVTVLSSSGTISWGAPQGDVATIARHTNSSSEFALFGYEEGATMYGGFIAPARRIGFFLFDETADNLTADGEALFNAAIDWAINPTVTYSLSVSVNGQGSVQPASGDYPEDTVLSMIATPAQGWHFVQWSGDMSGTGTPENLIMDSDKAVTANFAINTYEITATVVGNGTIQPNGATVDYGDNITFTFTPDVQNAIDYIVIDGVNMGAISEYTFSSVDASHSITAYFVAVYALSVSVGGCGDVMLDPPGGNYTEGTAVEVSANPCTGHHFTGWSGDLSGIQNPESVVMDGNKSVTATFEIDQFTIDASVAGNGTISPQGAVVVDYGANQQFTISPNTGSYIEKVEVNGSDIGAVETYLFENVTSNQTIVAWFGDYTAPNVSVAPLSQTKSEGESFTFTATVSGDPVPTLQWYKEGVGEIAGATEEIYSVPSASMSDAGMYYCVASNEAGTAESNHAQLDVSLACPVIESPPADQNLAEGASAQFGVTASGSEQINYQWEKLPSGGAWEVLSGETNATLSYGPVVQGDDLTEFRCNVYNAACSENYTAAALLRVNPSPLAITHQPVSKTVRDGETVSLSVEVVGSPPIDYVWYKDDVVLSGETAATLDLGAVEAGDAGDYHVVVGNGVGEDAVSVTAVVTVLGADEQLNSNKITIGGELYDTQGNPVGPDPDNPVMVDMEIRLYTVAEAGTPVYVETFLQADGKAASVALGLFSIRLGEGTTEYNLKDVIANNPRCFAEIVVTLPGQPSDTLSPRSPVTASPYLLTAE
jgi:hypothetical protein